MALWWLCTPESMPSICLVYGLAVASGGFEMNWPQHPKWNQPRKGAIDAARHSRSRSQNSLNAETQRFAEGRREGRKKGLFSSAFLRALCVSALILLSFEQVRILIPFSCAFCASSRQRGFPHLSRQMAHVPSILAKGSMQ